MSTQKEKGRVGVFRCRVKGRGKGDFFAEFLTSEKAEITNPLFSLVEI